MLVESRNTTTSSAKNNLRGSMKIDPKQSVKLSLMVASMYTELYSPIREYVSNGIRATRLAGSDKPVEVNFSSKTSADSIVTVQDFGIGMSFDDIMEQFVWIGRSSTDTDKDSAGGFGIGAKSGLSVAPSFLVSSTKDGEVTTLNIFSGDEGIEYEVIHRGTTDQDNGTTVSIPLSRSQAVSMWDDVKMKMAPFYSKSEVTFCHEGSVWEDSGAKIDNGYNAGDVIFSPNSNRTYAIVAGAPYEISFSVGDDYAEQRLINSISVIYCDNDEVTIPTSREGLEPSSLSINTITRKVKEGHRILNEEISKIVNGANKDNIRELEKQSQDVSSPIYGMNFNTFIGGALHYAGRNNYVVNEKGGDEFNSRNMIRSDSVVLNRYLGTDNALTREEVLKIANPSRIIEDYDTLADFLASPVQVKASSGYNSYTEENYSVDVDGLTAQEYVDDESIYVFTGTQAREMTKVVRSVSAKVLREERIAANPNSGSSGTTQRGSSFCTVLCADGEFDLEDLEDEGITFDDKIVAFVDKSMDNNSSRHARFLARRGDAIYITQYNTRTAKMEKLLGDNVEVYQAKDDFETRRKVSALFPEDVYNSVVPKSFAEKCKALNESFGLNIAYNSLDVIVNNVDFFLDDADTVSDFGGEHDHRLRAHLRYVENNYPEAFGAVVSKWGCRDLIDLPKDDFALALADIKTANDKVEQHRKDIQKIAYDSIT